MNAAGWRKVFVFTLIQQIKSKAFIISSAVISALIFIMAALINILPGLMASDGGQQSGAADFFTGRVYFSDSSGITSGGDYQKLFEDNGMAFTDAGAADNAGEYIDTVKNGSGCLFIELTYDRESGFQINVMRPADGSVSAEEADSAARLTLSAFSVYRLEKLGMAKENIPSAAAGITVSSTVAGEAEQSLFEYMIKMILPMVTSLILFVMIISYGQIIAQSVAMEKTSKVIELLLTSVKPLAIIIGKVLATGLLAVAQFIVFIAAGAAGFAAALPLGMGLSPLPEETGELAGAAEKVFSGFSPVTPVLILVIFILGFLFYALIAGLAGATVSRSEDINSAMQPFAVIGVAGLFLAYFPSASADGRGFMELLSYYLPLSSPFALPSALLTGRIGTGEAAVCILILALFTVMIAVFTARIYGQLILHTGSRVKFSELFGLAKKK